MAVAFHRSVVLVVLVVVVLLSTAAALTLMRPADGTESLPVGPLAPASPGATAAVSGTSGTSRDLRSSQDAAGASLTRIGASSPATNIEVLGHYPSYAVHHLPIDRIRYDRLTHIGYFSLLPLADGNLNASEVNEVELTELVAQAKAHGVKTIVVVGGWERSTHFPAMAADPDARANFVAKLLRYCLDHGLSGADLDWEPVSTVLERTNYSLLVEEAAREFEPFGLSLSVSVSDDGNEITPEAIAFVDSLNVMAYDGTPPHHSTWDLAVSALDHWENYGAPREKLMLGVPFYGKSEAGTGYEYQEIVATYAPGPETDFIAGIGFNGINTIRDKTAYVVNNRYRGIMIWEITQDVADESSLLRAVADTVTSLLPANLDGRSPVDFRDFQILASAWQTRPGDAGWNLLGDISQPQDSVVDSHDLAAFCGDWLAGR